MRLFAKHRKLKAVVVVAAVAAIVAFEAAPALALTIDGQSITPGGSLSTELYKSGSSSSPKRINDRQYIYNFYPAPGQSGNPTNLYLIVQDDGNLVLYLDDGHVCWSPNHYTTDGSNPNAYVQYNSSNNELELHWQDSGDHVVWNSAGYSGDTVDISGYTGSLYIGNTAYTSACHH